jgi:type II secretory pathway component PulC
MRAISWFALVLMGCAAHAPESEAPAIASGTTGPVATEVTSSPAPRPLRRDDVKAAIRAGLGTLLQRIELSDRPVFRDGRFKGFRVASLQGDASFLRGVDLERGDVITAVNGKSIERPEQALDVFHSLASAPEVRVAIERQGRPRELVFPIEDGPAPRP